MLLLCIFENMKTHVKHRLNKTLKGLKSFRFFFLNYFICFEFNRSISKRKQEF